jgi:hypothetical protein
VSHLDIARKWGTYHWKSSLSLLVPHAQCGSLPMHVDSLAARMLRTYLGITVTVVHSVFDQLLPSCLYSPVPTRNRMLFVLLQKARTTYACFLFPPPLPGPTAAEEQ